MWCHVSVIRSLAMVLQRHIGIELQIHDGLKNKMKLKTPVHLISINKHVDTACTALSKVIDDVMVTDSFL